MARRIGLFVGEGLGRPGGKDTSSTWMFDRQIACIAPALAARGMELAPVWWRETGADWSGVDAALALSAWDYQDHAQAFLAQLQDLETQGTPVLNPPRLIAWNIRKTYLRDLEQQGVPVIPTLWPESPSAADVRRAFDVFGCREVVLKRQVGAGARGQTRIPAGQHLPDAPLLDRPGMIQPFLESVASEGEFSYLFIDNVFSHAVVKRARAGDYRIQPRYGGQSEAIRPDPEDLAAARSVLVGLGNMFAGAPPLYARVDMARGDDGRLLLMELELIEPYLFVVEGPGIGAMLAEAVARRLGR